MNRRHFLTAAGATILLPQATWAGAGNCRGGLTTVCDRVTDRDYRGGGHRPDVIPITACLPPELFASIKLANGSAAWEAGFYYGRGQPEEVTTVRNERCWTEYRRGVRQHGAIGAYAVAFICCDRYCGWVGARIPASGKMALQPMRLRQAHDPMSSYRTSATAQTGQYDRNRILR